MSVDRTIEELSGTLAQLGVLVEHINSQIVGISSRVNVTLDNFDRAVAGIAQDAGLMTGQVGDTVAQIPSSWVFYVLFISLIIVLVLLSILIIINLIARICSICRQMSGESSKGTPLPSSYYLESKQPLNVVSHPSQPLSSVASPRERAAQICALPMEAEPKRYGGAGARTHPVDFAGIDNASYSSPSRVPQTGNAQSSEIYLTKRQPFNFKQQQHQQQQLQQQQQQQQQQQHQQQQLMSQQTAHYQPRHHQPSHHYPPSHHHHQQSLSRSDSDSQHSMAATNPFPTAVLVSPRAEAV